MAAEFLVLFILLLLSAFFSSTEIAYIISNKLKIEIRARKNKLSAKVAQYFSGNPQIFFSTILIGNNVSNIAFASLSAVILFEYFQYSDLTILLLSTFVLLILGELLPKYIATENSDTLIMIASIPVGLLTILLYPFVKAASSISSLLIRTTNINEESISQLFGKDDIHTLIHESSTVGQINRSDSDIISKVIDLGDQRVYEVITPRTDIVGVEISSTIDDTINLMIESGYSKLPVYEETIDDVKGFVHVYDMFMKPLNLSSAIRHVMFVPDTKKTLELLNEFLEKQTSMAVVIDEFGGTAGIVTVEDIIEEMLGEIRDEYDIEEEICKKTSFDTFVISGKVEIDFINDEFDLNIPTGDYETLAGFILSRLGSIPEHGQSFVLDNFKFLVLRSDKKRIELVKLQVLQN